jgi:selenocysteine-specific elongation factor
MSASAAVAQAHEGRESGLTPRVIGTAGHVDHGKSTLIHALTGIDPDRLREEKERGMTIDLGFAWLRLPSGHEASIVDVPGHERFIKNMLAGVGGIDIALLVVAADEGVMPQTREHLAILDLLGISAGVVALTKRDLVDAEWLELVAAEVEETLAPTTLAGAPIIPVSSTTGEGLEELRAELDRQLAMDRLRRQTGRPRLPVDRVFTMAGFGTVATGTLIDGQLRVGQEVEILPSGRRVRIRGLQSHRKQVETASAGTRVAVNLAGVATEDLERGEVITTPAWLKPTRVVDVRLRLVRDTERPLAHNALVTFHTGAAEALGRVGLLDANELQGGQIGWAQVRLDRALAVVRGDLFVIRLPSPSITIGGGTVVDEHPKRHRRYQARVLDQLAVLERGSPEDVLLQTLQTREPCDLAELAKRSALGSEEAREIATTLVAAGTISDLSANADSPGAASPQPHPLRPATLLISTSGWARMIAAVQDDLDRYHTAHHLRRGMPKEELRERLGLEPRVFTPVERSLRAQRVMVEDGPYVRRPEYAVRLSADEQRGADTLVQLLGEAGVSPPSPSELTARCRVSEELLQALVDQGMLVAVAPDLVYRRETYDEIIGKISALIGQHGSATVAQVRDALGTSRKYALAILEHLDDRHITRRIGDTRVLA